LTFGKAIKETCST